MRNKLLTRLQVHPGMQMLLCLLEDKDKGFVAAAVAISLSTVAPLDRLVKVCLHFAVGSTTDCATFVPPAGRNDINK